MNEKEQKVIMGATMVFMKYGIKSVNMDDIARNLGISKKTLYKYVKDKADLVGKAMGMHCEIEDKGITEICEKGLNSIDENLEIMQFILSILGEVHPSIMFDMEKYYPEILADTLEQRHHIVYDCLYSNMEKGKKEGLYREDMDSDILSKVYITSIDGMFSAKLFPVGEKSLSDIYREMFRYHIRGIASDKGREYLKEKMKTNQNIF